MCKVGAMAHPSFMNESHVSGVDGERLDTRVGLITDAFKAPLYIAAPSTDSLFMPGERARTVEVLTKGEKRFNMQIYSNVSHGFAVSIDRRSLGLQLADVSRLEPTFQITTRDGPRSTVSRVLSTG